MHSGGGQESLMEILPSCSITGCLVRDWLDMIVHSRMDPVARHSQTEEFESRASRFHLSKLIRRILETGVPKTGCSRLDLSFSPIVRRGGAESRHVSVLSLRISRKYKDFKTVLKKKIRLKWVCADGVRERRPEELLDETENDSSAQPPSRPTCPTPWRSSAKFLFV